MKKMHRILAAIGAGLIVVAVVTILLCTLIPAWHALLLNISLLCTGAAALILAALLYVRSRAQEQAQKDEDGQ